MVETSNHYGSRTLLDDINDELDMLNRMRNRIWVNGHGLNPFGKKMASIWYQSGYNKREFISFAACHTSKKTLNQIDKIWENKGLLPEKK